MIRTRKREFFSLGRFYKECGEGSERVEIRVLEHFVPTVFFVKI